MTYPTTTRTLYGGIQASRSVVPANMYFLHTMNEPQHTLNNGLVLFKENTGTRMKDNGTARGKRSATFKTQAYIRHDELGIWLESAIGTRSTTDFASPTVQTVTITGTPTGGTFTLKLGSAGTPTAGIAHNAIASAVQSALEATPDIAPGDIAVTGGPGPGTPWVVAFLPTGALPYNTVALVADGASLSGGTTPAATAANKTLTGVYKHVFTGGIVTGNPLCLQEYNGLYWRQMLNQRVSGLNIQGFGNQMAMADINTLGPASLPLGSAPTPIDESNDYNPVDMPMQSGKFNGSIDADIDRISVNITNDLSQRSTMDGTTSAGRTRFGDFTVAIDGMVDYPAYSGSLYESFENNFHLGDMDVVMIDDLHDLEATYHTHPSLDIFCPDIVFADTSEGSDNGELVQMVKGSAIYDPDTAAGVVITLINDKPGSYYTAS